MSKAYRVIEITSESSSFNLWDDFELVKFLDREMLFSLFLNPDDTGLVEIPVDLLEKALALSNEMQLADETVSQLKLDIRAAKSKNDNSLTCYCC
jgi:hypothetical protein